MLAIAGYVILYSHDSRALQLWYAASFGAPLLLVCAPAVAALSEGRLRSLVLATVVLAIVGTFALSMRPGWANQKSLEHAGQLLAARPELQPVGAWNAGLIGYFSGRSVTNLDGLVNDQILPYARSGTLIEYVRRRHLAYIIDYAAMLNGKLARRGGYADGALASCLQPLVRIDAADSASHWEDTAPTLYRVDAACIDTHTMRAP